MENACQRDLKTQKMTLFGVTISRQNSIELCAFGARITVKLPNFFWDPRLQSSSNLSHKKEMLLTMTNHDNLKQFVKKVSFHIQGINYQFSRGRNIFSQFSFCLIV